MSKQTQNQTTGAELLFAQQTNNNATIVALVDHNGKSDWWRISMMHDPKAAYCQYTYFVINSRGEQVGHNKPYIHSEQKGIALPGEWTHKSARATAELTAHLNEAERQQCINTLVASRETMTVKVTMFVKFPYTKGMKAYATRREICDDIINWCKVGAQAHLDAIGQNADIE